MDLGYPWRIDGLGRTATTGLDAHVRDLIEQVLFTSPGERVNRPSFGSGAQQMVFTPASLELATALSFQVQAALQQWLGEAVHVEDVKVQVQESTLAITVRYVSRRTQERTVTTVRRPV